MKKSEFIRLPEDGPKEMKLFEKFLEGHAMIGQKDKKKPGNQITYYEVIKIYNDTHYEYTHKFDILEED